MPFLHQALSEAEHIHKEELENKLKEMHRRFENQIEMAENQHKNEMARLKEDYSDKFNEMREQLEIGKYFFLYGFK